MTGGAKKFLIIPAIAWLYSLTAISGESAAATPPSLKKIGERVIDPAGLNYSQSRWGTCPNGKSHQMDATATQAGWQYATWYDGQKRLCVGRCKLPDGQWERIHFDDYKHTRVDTHNVPVVGVCPADGTIHLSFDHHANPLHYRVSKKGAATDPGKTKWVPELFGPVTSKLNPGEGALRSVTYPCFLAAPDGKLYLLFRAGGSGQGDWKLYEYNGETGKWLGLGTVISGKGTYAEKGKKKSSSRCGYPNGMDFDAKGRLHMTWCWRESGDPMSNHDVCYAYSDDRGRTWFNSAGTKVGEAAKPLGVQAPGIAVWKIETGRGLLNTTGQAVDGKGRLHVVMSHVPAGEPVAGGWKGTRKKSHYFHYWRDLKGQWHQNAIDPKRVPLGSRPKLVLDKQDTLYLVIRAGKVAAATAEGEWKDWAMVFEESGSFVTEPMLDRYRWRDEGILSLFLQRKPAKPGQPSEVVIIDLKPESVKHPPSQ